MESSRVCAIVVTYNRIGLLAQCLEGVRSQSRKVDRLIVIDNASTDSTVETLHSEFPDATVITLGENTGASGGFAAGFQAALKHEWDWLWVLDDDVVPEANCLEELLGVAAASMKHIVAPRRRARAGFYPRHEAVIDERSQSYAAPSGETRWSPIDLFTFEGPLIRRLVVEKVGLPNARFFIIADDTEYAVRVYQEFGPLSAALANETAVDRLLIPPEPVIVNSRLIRLFTGDGRVELHPDDEHWKKAYYFRNRHLIWKMLSWRERRFRQILAHAVYIVTDLLIAARRGWDWRLRLAVNTKAFWMGVLGRDGILIHPADYHAALVSRRSKKTRAPAPSTRKTQPN